MRNFLPLILGTNESGSTFNVMLSFNPVTIANQNNAYKENFTITPCGVATRMLTRGKCGILTIQDPTCPVLLTGDCSYTWIIP